MPQEFYIRYTLKDGRTGVYGPVFSRAQAERIMNLNLTRGIYTKAEITLEKPKSAEEEKPEEEEEKPAPLTVPTTEAERGTMDTIIAEITGVKQAGTLEPYATREQLIESLTGKYGETYRQFIVDTAYRELRGPPFAEVGEPAYVPPAYEVYGVPPAEGEMPDWAQTIIDLIDKRWKALQEIGKFEWTDEDTARVKAEFEELYGPYYTAMGAVAKRGAREAIEALEATRARAVRREERNLEEALAESRTAMRERGLAFSGIRAEEERKIGEVSTEEMARIRDIAARGRREELARLEAAIGTRGVQALYPGYEIAPEYRGLGIEFPRGAAIPGIPGTIPVEREMAYRQELARREAEERQKYLSDILMAEEYSI